MDRSCRSVVLAGVLAGVAAMLVGALAPPTAHAAAKRSVVLEVTAAGGGSDWRAEALARTLTADLADDRLAPRPAPPCGGPCSDAALRAAGVELVVRATLAAGSIALAYELRALWPGAPVPVRGAIGLGSLDRVAFAGVLRDQLHRMARATNEEDDAGEAAAASAPPAAPGAGSGATAGSAAGSGATAGSAAGAGSGATAGSAVDAGRGATAGSAAGSGATAGSAAGVVPSAPALPAVEAHRASGPVVGLPAPGDVALALAAVLAALAVPIAIGSLRARRLVARKAALHTLIGTSGAGAFAIALAAIDPGNSRGLMFAAGGLAWGAVFAVTLPIVFPPLIGMARIDYPELIRLLGGWLGLVVRRAIAVAIIYLPVALAVALLGDAIAPSSAVQFAIILPLALLIERQWLRLAIAAAAERLDAALTDTAVDATAWHDAVRGYTVGYLRRNGLPIDADLLDRLVILPALGDEVCLYGGGATHTRLAIPRRMLELALAPWGRPHDYAAPRVSTLHWTQWNAGLVMASEPGAVIATREQRQPRVTTTEGDPSDNAREHLGEPPTLIGIIEPRALDPRTGYRPHDDPAWLDWEGEEYDGTDAGDRDFLFGVVGHAIAAIQRHADRFATLALMIERIGRTGRARWLGRITAPAGRLLAAASDAIADDHAAVSGARHHLAQYLAWQAWQREDLLTARAYAPELEAMSRRLLEMTGEPPVARKDFPAATRARARLARLAGLVSGTAPRTSRWRRFAMAGALLAGAGAAALAVADAVRYHALYTERSLSGASSSPENPRHGQN